MLNRKKVENDILVLQENDLLNNILYSKNYSMVFIDTFLTVDKPSVLGKIKLNMLKYALLNLTNKELKRVISNDFVQKLKDNNMYKSLESLLYKKAINDGEIIVTMDKKAFKEKTLLYQINKYMYYNPTYSKSDLIDKIKNTNYHFTYMELINSNSDIFKDKEVLLTALSKFKDKEMYFILSNKNIWEILSKFNIVKEAIEILEKTINFNILTCKQTTNFVILKYFFKVFIENNFSFNLKKAPLQTKMSIQELTNKLNNKCGSKTNPFLNGYVFIYNAEGIWPELDIGTSLKDIIIDFIKKDNIVELYVLSKYKNLMHKIAYNEHKCFKEVKTLLEEIKLLTTKNNECYFCGEKIN